MRTDRLSALPRICGTKATKPSPTPLVGGAGPLKMPVTLMVGAARRELPSAFAEVCRAPSAPADSSFEFARGTTHFVTRADCSDDGPDLTLFTSNAVTA